MPAQHWKRARSPWQTCWIFRKRCARATPSSDSPGFGLSLRVCFSSLTCLAAQVGSFTEAMGALERLSAVVELLMTRCSDSSTSARVVLQQQCLLLIGDTFSHVLPLPLPLDAPEEVRARCIWTSEANAPTKKAQLECLGSVHTLMKTYGTLWQVVENPSRPFDSERAVVVASMFSIFDAVLRLSGAWTATQSDLLQPASVSRHCAKV